MFCDFLRWSYFPTFGDAKISMLQGPGFAFVTKIAKAGIGRPTVDGDLCFGAYASMYGSATHKAKTYLSLTNAT